MGSDSVIEAGRLAIVAVPAHENAEAVARDFRQYLEANRDEIEALTIFYGQPHPRRELTYAMIREVFDRLKSDQPRLSPLRVWRSYALLDEYKGGQPFSELTAVVALIRRVCGIDATVSPYSDTVRRNFRGTKPEGLLAGGGAVAAVQSATGVRYG